MFVIGRAKGQFNYTFFSREFCMYGIGYRPREKMKGYVMQCGLQEIFAYFQDLNKPASSSPETLLTKAIQY